MTHERDTLRATAVSLTITAVLGLSWALPLTSSTVAMTMATLAGLAIIVLWRPMSAADWRFAFGETATVASCALLLVGAIGVGYAAFALGHADAFGSVRRLGYPFLVATGLRLPGGACLFILCGIVSVIPLVFQADEAQTAASTRAARSEPLQTV